MHQRKIDSKLGFSGREEAIDDLLSTQEDTLRFYHLSPNFGEVPRSFLIIVEDKPRDFQGRIDEWHPPFADFISNPQLHWKADAQPQRRAISVSMVQPSIPFFANICSDNCIIDP